MQQRLYALAAHSSASYLACCTRQRLLTTLFAWGQEQERT